MNIRWMILFSFIGTECSCIFTFTLNGRVPGSSIFEPPSSDLLAAGSEGATKTRVY
jgi:hypothetical protein